MLSGYYLNLGQLEKLGRIMHVITYKRSCRKVMFSQVSVSRWEEGPHVIIIHDALALTVQAPFPLRSPLCT